MTVAANPEDPVRFAWLARFFGRCMAAYIAFVARTVRVSSPSINQGQAIFTFWHENNLASTVAARRLREDQSPVVFSTRGFRGIVMNTMLGSLGADALTLPDEGAATRGEATSLSRQMARLAR
ncbi:MAG TPA: hypothetical protein VF153_03485, partial [Candidatus Limnocylindria bacterium]